MVESISVPAAAAAPGSAKPAGRPASEVEDAARQFESLLLAQMLKAMRQADSGGWLGAGEEEAGSAALELAEEQFAQALSASGGLGLAKLVASGLNCEKKSGDPAPESLPAPAAKRGAAR